MANKRFKRQEYARYKKLGIKWRRPRGKTNVLVHNMQELEDLDPACDAARISASIGKRKKAMMLEKASELGIKVLNK